MILFSAAAILKQNIIRAKYVLPGESGGLAVIGGCKGLHWKKKGKKQLTIPLALSQSIAL